MPTDGLPPKDAPEVPDWRELADQASKEPDGHKVSDLVRRICDTLDEVEAEKKKRFEEAVVPRAARVRSTEP
jgi:hypothetical protein